MSSEPTVVVLVGPTCSGKTRLAQALEKSGFAKVVTTTTREPRLTEANGVDYNFVSAYDFEAMDREGKLIERGGHSGVHYGTESVALEKALDRGRGNAVLVMEPQGAAAMREHCDCTGKIRCVLIWVACDPEVQMRRFVHERVPKLKPAQLVARLTEMMVGETQWRHSAAVAGRLVGSPYRFNMEFWKAGPEMEDIYLEAILGLVEKRPTRYVHDFD